MKAIVLEVQNGVAAVLREDGEVLKLRRRCSVGDSIELDPQSVVFPFWRRKTIQTAAAAALTIAVLGGSYTYLAIPANAYVSLDAGKTSVEVGVNRLGRITSVNPVNSDSEEIAMKLTEDLRGKPVELAIPHAVTALSEDASDADQEEDYIIAGITASSETQQTELQQTVTAAATSVEGEALKIYTLSVTTEERKEAAGQEQSAGRLAFLRRGIKRSVKDDDAESVKEKEAQLQPVQTTPQTNDEKMDPSAQSAASEKAPAAVAAEKPTGSSKAENTSTVIPEITVEQNVPNPGATQAGQPQPEPALTQAETALPTQESQPPQIAPELPQTEPDQPILEAPQASQPAQPVRPAQSDPLPQQSEPEQPQPETDRPQPEAEQTQAETHPAASDAEAFEPELSDINEVSKSEKKKRRRQVKKKLQKKRLRKMKKAKKNAAEAAAEQNQQAVSAEQQAENPD